MNHFYRVLESFHKAKARYVVVGGFATVMHGSNRFTSDLDIIVDFAPVECTKVIDCLSAIGFKPRVPVKPTDFADPELRKKWIEEKNMKVFSFIDSNDPTFAVDVFVEHPINFEELFSNSVVLPLKDISIRLCSIEHLIVLKQMSGRAQDLIDINNLEILKTRKK